MAKNDIIKVFCFDTEIGALGWDENRAVSFFQYHPDFLASNKYVNLIPQTGIIRRIKEVQLFKQFNGETFRGLPPMLADSLPDLFGNIVFKAWLENNDKNFSSISVLEQLAYVAERGMGAFEFKPKKEIPLSTTIDLDEIVEVLKLVMDLKKTTSSEKLNHHSLLTIFKIGTSAGGARPKILISENKEDGKIIPGDITYSNDYNHYLVKLNLDDESGYNREMIEYSYYLTCLHCGINMMDSKMIENKHFATKRFDRIGGEKQHVLTVSGLTGWDFKDPTHSSYENIFELALFLKIPHAEIVELYRRMIFNIVFANQDDHLKNHTFIYDKSNDSWHLSPAYDVTYSQNPLMNYKRTSRALSINNKRTAIDLTDVTLIAQKYTIKNYLGIIQEVQNGIEFWNDCTVKLDIPRKVVDGIVRDFVELVTNDR
jgi:serine/threonine-protein kinase HipA